MKTPAVTLRLNVIPGELSEIRAIPSDQLHPGSARHGLSWEHSEEQLSLLTPILLVGTAVLPPALLSAANGDAALQRLKQRELRPNANFAPWKCSEEPPDLPGDTASTSEQLCLLFSLGAANSTAAAVQLVTAWHILSVATGELFSLTG